MGALSLIQEAYNSCVLNMAIRDLGFIALTENTLKVQNDGHT